jgi:hypothetical protein
VIMSKDISGATLTDGEIAGILDSLQGKREQQLVVLSDAILAGRALMQVETRRLQQKLGPTDVRVLGMLDKIEMGRTMAGSLGVEMEIAQIRVEPVEEGTTVIHGRLTDSTYRGIEGVQLRFADASNNVIKSIPPVDMGISGYFSVSLTSAQVRLLEELKKVTLVVVSGNTTVAPAGGIPFPVARGVATFKEIALSDAELKHLGVRFMDLSGRVGVAELVGNVTNKRRRKRGKNQ